MGSFGKIRREISKLLFIAAFLLINKFGKGHGLETQEKGVVSTRLAVATKSSKYSMMVPFRVGQMIVQVFTG